MRPILMFLAAFVYVALVAAPAPAQTPPAHRIQIRTVKGEAEFYDVKTGKKFVPRGHNYVRLENMKKLTEPTSMVYHSTFNEGRYDKKRASTALKAMAADGYNVVRVFLNHATEGSIDAGSKGLSGKYLDNFADFLALAKANGLYVIPTIDWIPIPKKSKAVEQVWCPDYQCTNVHILTRDGVEANKAFFVAFIRELVKRKAPTSYILAYELRNELTFESDLPPLSLKSGTVTTVNGKTYDLSDERQKRAMLEEGLVYWVDQVRAAIRAVSPTALVTVGLVPPQFPNPIGVGDTRFSVSAPVVRSSTLDFIDIHVYPAADKISMKEFAENFGIVGVKNKPVIFGEFGGLLATYASAEAAAQAMVEWQGESAKFGIDGWIFWSWDMDEPRDSWTALEQEAVLNDALAPKKKPDPASARRTVPAVSAGIEKTARASGTFEGAGPELAIDGTMRQWTSGGFPPQWIELDLKKPQELSKIRLTVGQSPDGPTVHQVWIKSPGRDYVMSHEFKGDTKDSQVLEYLPAPGVVVAAVKIVTTASPSWVGWREIDLVKAAAK